MKRKAGREAILDKKQWSNLLENLFLVILVFYPLRHIYTGVDLWDTGYNYANFQYMGMEHMDPMWLFSTYLANVVGNVITKLPNADTLVGMNLYTGLFVSALALAGYFFCTRKLKFPRWIAFLGEMLAISLCWCPTALLYNYLTYLLFLFSCILLYCGLTKENPKYLVLAGVLLGANVLTRFSNLPEMGMIAAVWAYDLIVWLEECARRKKGTKVNSGESAGTDSKVQFWPRVLKHTLWCLLGYVAALGVLLLYIQIRYGLDEYAAGIMRLFAMTDKATDYKPTSMIMGLIGAYVENLYWVIRFGVLVVGGLAAFAAGGLSKQLSGKRKALWTGSWIIITVVIFAVKYLKEQSEAIDLWFGQPVIFNFLFEPDGLFLLLLLLCVAFGWAKKAPRVLMIVASITAVFWLYYRGFCSWAFYSYDSMLRPGILFLMLTMFIAAVRIFHRGSPREEKLISGMLILIILLTSLGSNNGVYPSINNLFLAAPYTLWQSWRFVKNVGEKSFWKPFPVKCLLMAFLALCTFQFAVFGGKFVFAEATGVQDTGAKVTNNVILKNVNMAPDRAQWLTEISDYVADENLQGREVILYGNIPALSFYLQMPSAFNPWSDLASYSYAVMEQEIGLLEGLISEKGAEKPVIILENLYGLYQEGGPEAMTLAGVTEAKIQQMDADNKLQLLLNFMDNLGYEQVFRNEKFALYR